MFFMGILLLTTNTGLAQQQENSTEPIEEFVVTAPAPPAPPKEEERKTSFQSTTISRKLIDTQAPTRIETTLQNVTGGIVTVSGNQSTLSLLGARSEDTLVVIDGMEANDPSSTTGVFDLSTIDPRTIDTIEVTKGPSSVVYGIRNAGGIVDIKTRRGEVPSRWTLGAEVGSHQTFSEGVSYEDANNTYDFSATASHFDTEGVSSAAAKYGNKEKDGMSRSAVSARGTYRYSNDFTVSGSVRVVYKQDEIDAFPGPGGDDPDDVLNSQSILANAAANLKVTDRWKTNFLLGAANTLRTHINESSDPLVAAVRTHYRGNLANAEWRNSIETMSQNTMHTGIKVTEERSGSEKRIIPAVYLEDSFRIDESLEMQLGTRLENVNGLIYGVRGGTKYHIFEGSEVYVSAGNSMKPPTLFQIHSEYGNKGLRAEKSFGVVAGVAQSFEKIRFDVSLFRNSFEETIDFDFINSRYLNLGKSLAWGIEGALDIPWSNKISSSFHYTFLKTKNKVTGDELLRKPKHKGSISLQAKITDDVTTWSTAQYIGKRIDLSLTGRESLPPYFLWNAGGSLSLSENFSTHVRVENLLNQRYEDTWGYGTQPISFFCGAQLSI